MKNRHSSILLKIKTLISAMRRCLLPTIVAVGYGGLSWNAQGQCSDGCDFNRLSTFQGYSALQLSPGHSNSAFGHQALAFFVSGDDNTAVGSQALSGTFDTNGEPSSTGGGNTAVGVQALHSDFSGSVNTAIGLAALGFNSDGSSNTAAGAQALRDNTSGSYNTASGREALYSNQNGSYNTATGYSSLSSNTTGFDNTATGASALYANSIGHDNTANGAYTLYYTTGELNTAVGAYALFLNTTGVQNTAVGVQALGGVGTTYSTASFNTATGYQALYSMIDGQGNVADGVQALYGNSSGRFNVGVGVSALKQNTNGSFNTALGTYALYNNTGSNNIALGYQAGENLTTGSNNIVIGAGLLGKAGEANTTRIGKTTQTAAYIGGIYNKTVASASGVAVRIDSTGKLGTVLSSARYKDHIQPMKEASEAVLQLEPVTFNYKKELDPDGVKQFGLIAEQVEKIDPDLVVKDEEGRVSTVRYEAVNAMLLNEFLKAHRQLQQQRKEIAALGADLAEQKMLIQKVNEQLAANRAESQTIAATFQQH